MKFYSFLKWIVVFTIISQLISFLSIWLLSFFDGYESVFKIYEEDTGLHWMLVESVLIAPVVETLIMGCIFEIFLVSLSGIFPRYRNIISIALCGLFFGLFHFYNIIYMITTAIIGVVYAYAYFFFKSKDNRRDMTNELVRVKTVFGAMTGLILVHMLDNLITIFFYYS